MQVVIPSRGRAGTLADKALRLFPNALVCVGESERDDYYKVSKNLLIHPDNIEGIGPLRQWILDNVKDEVVLQVDDDVYKFSTLTGFTQIQIKSLSAMMRIVANTANCAADAGASVFGFNQTWDVRKYRPYKPILLSSWAGGVIGFVGRKHRFDMNLLLRADIDFCLTCLLKDRITWVENRFSFIHKRFVGSGGNNSLRSAERHEAEIEYLKKKWGGYLKFAAAKGTIRMNPDVDRNC